MNADAVNCSFVVVRIEFAWWLMPYLEALLFFCNLMQGEPDLGKLDRVVARAVRFTVVE